MSLPPSFINELNKLAELEPRVNGLADALRDTAPSVSIRFNRAKCPSLPASVAGVIAGNPVPWCPWGLYLGQRPLFTFDPAIHQGLYYVQDASSMFITHVIKSLTQNYGHPVTYLDACAAPGGKTTAAIDSLPEGSLVVANEWDYRRAEILRENIIKWGYPATVVSRGDTRYYSKMRETFDIIAADVPCSGEGMMRKDDEAVSQWSPALIEQCTTRQREIIGNLWPSLKQGGYLIYSTCTFNRDENEQMVDYLVDSLGAEPVAIDGSEKFDGILPGIATQYPCYRFMPHRIDGEGLFMAVVKKNGEIPTARRDKTRESKPAKLPFRLPDWIPANIEMKLIGDTLYGISPAWKTTVEKLMATGNVIMPGIEIATVKGRDLIPSQGLAMSTAFKRGTAPEVEVNRDLALDYLRRDTITLPEGTMRGHVLLTHNSHPLGWVKNLGNRANNLYPSPWRILHR